MFDFSWSEMMVIGAIALVAIGPKDLPKALKTAGMVVRKARGLAREFHNSVEEMIRESELDEVRRSVHEATNFDINRPERLPAPPTPAVMTGPPPSAPPPGAVSTDGANPAETLSRAQSEPGLPLGSGPGHDNQPPAAP